MSDILFGQAYFLRFDAKQRDAMQPYAPLGSLYAAAYLRNRGYDVAFFDAMLARSEAEWEQALERERPRFAVLFEDNFNYLTKMCLLRMRQAAMSMIEMAGAAGCTTVVCGSDATDHADLYLAAGADYVIVGEGEATLSALVDRLAGRTATSLEAIDGLAFRRHNGAEIVRTGPRPVLQDLDALPWPAWDLVDAAAYRDTWRARHGYFSMNMVTSRGCPYHCNWCAKPIWGQRYNVRSPESVVDEILWLKERFSPDHLWFMDDVLGIKPGWLAAFADRIEETGARIPFKCLTRTDLLLREGEIDALRRAGCEIVWSGVESGSQAILDAMDKGTTVEQARQATQRLHAVGIRAGFFLQFGYPGESRKDIQRTFELVRHCDPDEIGVSVTYPLPGTGLHEAVKSQLGSKENWVDSDDLAMMYRGPFTTAFYRKAHRVLHKEFRTRLARRNLGSLLRQPATLRTGHLREIAILLAHTVTLPLERLQLERISRASHDATETLPRIKSRRAAATPTRF